MTEIQKDDPVRTLLPPRLINVQIGTVWNIVTPPVYRYEDEKWINGFFETGQLRLSTFAKFATYEDEIRGDPHEGTGMGYGETPDGKSVFVVGSEGAHSLVLCCTHRLDHELGRSFGRDSAFQIMDTLGFAAEISRQLPGFKGGMEGSCLYRSETMIRRKIDFDLEKYKRADGNIDMQAILDAGASLGGPERLLLKQKKYEKQQEYRFLWHLDSVSGEHLDVICPLARQFCRKIESSDYH